MNLDCRDTYLVPVVWRHLARVALTKVVGVYKQCVCGTLSLLVFCFTLFFLSLVVGLAFLFVFASAALLRPWNLLTAGMRACELRGSGRSWFLLLVEGES